jgi:Protein of unknown function (DUF2789)
METHHHDLSHLFRQLGYSGDAIEIDAFVAAHRLGPGEVLAQASFWNPAQSHFLASAFAEDADWSRPADELAVRLS